MAKFTKIPADTFKQLQINAGVILSSFTPATGAFEAEDQIGRGVGVEAEQLTHGPRH